ncbi:hypothetical protein OQA88_12326 [Cercophora sp. LCS_1]
MPVTRSRTYLADLNLEDSNNTTGFLFGDEDSNPENRTTPTNNPDSFPALLRQQGYTALLSSNPSTALDLAQTQSSTAETAATNGWNSISKHRSQASMSTIGGTPINGAAATSEAGAIGSRPASIRHSMDGTKFFADASSNASETASSAIVSPQTTHVMASPPKLQQSYSANDVPTVKSTSAAAGIGANANNHAQQHFQNHNASLGRIPVGAMPNRHSREMSNDSGLSNGRENGAYPSIGSTLHANAAPFAAGVHNQTSAPGMPGLASPAPMQFPYYNGGYPTHNGAPTPGAYPGVPMLMQSMQAMSIGSSSPASMYSPNYNSYNALYSSPPRQPQDSQARVIQSRRQQESEAMARYNNLPLESVGGTIYTLCKDQHGCRYLQKQLENRMPEQIHMIWVETNQHVVELMTDPFGNYLCQKLLEYCTDDERTVLIQNASEAMVRIALNQHGTRALQKMIEHVSTPVQVKLIIDALRHQVVELIQDLNGNHVIQKCLNKLSATDAHFIFEAVGMHCVEVGTHRHGCCVLQRCIDHADGPQKVWLVECITKNAVTLIQDPFGNYVVQYIIDLNQEVFTEPVVQQFKGRITTLSKHKFSSNVIEKCLRCASPVAKDMIVDELLTPGEMPNLLRDNFANYVIQTALEYATTPMKIRLVEAIRPVLPSIRATPYGRRIQAKVQAYDNRANRATNELAPGVPGVHDASGGQTSVRPAASRGPNGTQVASPQANILDSPTPYANGAANGPPSLASQLGIGNYPTLGHVSVPGSAQTQAPPRPQQFQAHQYLGGGPPTENGEAWL